MTKTLKQLLEEKPHYKDKNIIQYQLDAVKEWLTQKRQEQNEKRKKEQKELLGYPEYYGAKCDILTELLEELNQ